MTEADEQVYRGSATEARTQERRDFVAVIDRLQEMGTDSLGQDLKDVFTDESMPDGAPVLRLALSAQEDVQVLTRREMRAQQGQASGKKRRGLFRKG